MQKGEPNGSPLSHFAAIPLDSGDSLLGTARGHRRGSGNAGPFLRFTSALRHNGLLDQTQHDFWIQPFFKANRKQNPSSI